MTAMHIKVAIPFFKTLRKTLMLLGVIITVTTFYSCEDIEWSLESSQGTSKCVDDIIEQLTGDGKLDIDKSDMKFGIKAPNIPTSKHVQGIGRLRDWNGMGRMVLTENGSGKGFRVGFHPIENATEGLYSTVREMPDVVDFDIQDVSAYGNHDHPGGLQANGDYVAVAMEGEYPGHAAVYFLKVDGRDIEFITSLVMDGSRGEPYQASQNRAATVGFVQQASGHFLVAVSGKDHGAQGIWFYESTTQFIIDETTEWDFISFKKFGCEGYGQEQDNCYVGAGGGLNLVMDCSGDIYMLAMHGSSIEFDWNPFDGNGFGIFEKDREWLQVFRILKTDDNINVQKVTQQRDKFGSMVIDEKSFRWAGGSYVSRNGTLAIFNTERRFRLGDNDFVDGHVYLREE